MTYDDVSKYRINYSFHNNNDQIFHRGSLICNANLNLNPKCKACALKESSSGDIEEYPNIQF